jgi:hypothetical protein
MTLDKNQKELITIGAVVAGIVVIVLIGKKLADIVAGFGGALGLTETEADKKAAAAVAATENKDYFSPSYLKRAPLGTKVVLLTSASANAKAKRIFDAIGILTDNENEIVGAFNDLSTKSQVSFLAQAFKNLYKQDLLNFLRTKLDTQSQKDALISILKRLDKLPNYTK